MSLKQGFMDFLITWGIFGALGIVIITKLKQQNHPAYRTVKGWFDKGKEKKLNMEEIKEQTTEKRWF